MTGALGMTEESLGKTVALTMTRWGGVTGLWNYVRGRADFAFKPHMF